jgi:hypothetical protein
MSLGYGSYTYIVATTPRVYRETNLEISVAPASSYELIEGLTWSLSAGDTIKVTLVSVQSFPPELNWSMVYLDLTVYRIKNSGYLYYYAGTRLSVNFTDLEQVYDSNFTLLDWSQSPNSTITFTCQREETEYYFGLLVMNNTDSTAGVEGTYDLEIVNYFDATKAQVGVTFLILSVIPFAVAALLLPIHRYYFSRGKKGEKVSKAQVGAELETRRSEEIQKSMNHEVIKDYGSEFSVTGNTFRVYWFLLCKRHVSIGLREIQRALGFLSPNSAVYQLEKLMKLGLIEKDDMGDYFVKRIAKIGFLRNFLFLGTHALPKDLIYCMATVLVNILCGGLQLSAGFSPLAYLALIPGTLASIIFLHEAIRTWNYKQRMTETVEHGRRDIERIDAT